MASVRQNMVFGLHRQSVINGLSVAWLRKDFVTVATPKRDGTVNGKRLARESIAYGR